MSDTNEVLLENLLNAARELAGYASYAEIVGGVSVNRPQVRQWCDAVFAAVRALPEDEDFEPSVKDWVTRAERDAHVAAALQGAARTAFSAIAKYPLRTMLTNTDNATMLELAILALITPAATTALADLIARERAEAHNAAIEAAVKVIDKRAEDYDREFGSYDYSTGVTEYPGTGSESMEEWEELSSLIRAALSPTQEQTT